MSGEGREFRNGRERRAALIGAMRELMKRIERTKLANLLRSKPHSDKARVGREWRIARARADLAGLEGWNAGAVDAAIKDSHQHPENGPGPQAARFVGHRYEQRMKWKKGSRKFMGWYDKNQKAGAPSLMPSTYRAARAAEDAYFLAFAGAMIGKAAAAGGRARGQQLRASAKAKQIPAALEQVRGEDIPRRKRAGAVAKRVHLTPGYVRKKLPK